MKEIEKNLNEYYNKNLEEYGSNAKGVGWKSTEAQTIRFKQLCKIIKDKTQFSINDLGCGVADLLTYLQVQHFEDFQYFGYDMLETMITQAKALHTPASNAGFRQIEHARQLTPADYTVASGIFNLKYNLPEHEWLAFILETIHLMNENSLKGFSFNVLTKYSDKDYMQEHLYYADPLFLFDFCKRNYSKNVALLHDYTEYDFTILVRK